MNSNQHHIALKQLKGHHDQVLMAFNANAYQRYERLYQMLDEGQISSNDFANKIEVFWADVLETRKQFALSRSQQVKHIELSIDPLKTTQRLISQHSSIEDYKNETLFNCDKLKRYQEGQIARLNQTHTDYEKQLKQALNDVEQNPETSMEERSFAHYLYTKRLRDFSVIKTEELASLYYEFKADMTRLEESNSPAAVLKQILSESTEKTPFADNTLPMGVADDSILSTEYYSYVTKPDIQHYYTEDSDCDHYDDFDL